MSNRCGCNGPTGAEYYGGSDADWSTTAFDVIG